MPYVPRFSTGVQNDKAEILRRVRHPERSEGSQP